jgi:hypothetical protein
MLHGFDFVVGGALTMFMMRLSGESNCCSSVFSDALGGDVFMG